MMGLKVSLLAAGAVLAYILLGAATARLSRKSLFKARVFGEKQKHLAHFGGTLWPILWAAWIVALPLSLVHSAIGWLAGIRHTGKAGE